MGVLHTLGDSRRKILRSWSYRRVPFLIDIAKIAGARGGSRCATPRQLKAAVAVVARTSSRKGGSPRVYRRAPTPIIRIRAKVAFTSY